MEIISNKEQEFKTNDISILKLLGVYEVDKIKEMKMFFHRLPNLTKRCFWFYLHYLWFYPGHYPKKVQPSQA